MAKRNKVERPVVLLIDDSPDIHRLLTFKLKDEGVEFLTAFSGLEGVELAESNQPALILLDVNMPDHDGFEALHCLKDNPVTTGIPVIMLTGSAESANKVRAFELGAMDYVTKPVDVPELKARIQSAIRITRLMKLLEQRAQIDGLTGLWNRSHFNNQLDAAVNESTRKHTPLALAICDLDHFKKLNDTFGHPAGDAVLQGFAQLLSEEVRSYDVPCRYGGEEFAIILPGAAAEEALALCERVRKSLETLTFAKYPKVRATGSFGVATAPFSGETDIAGWIKAADTALYSAKTGGRNRTHVFGRDCTEADAENTAVKAA